MSDNNLPPQPPQDWQDGQETTPLPPVPPVPQVPTTAPTQVIPPAPPAGAGQFGAQQPFGGSAQPPFGGTPAQQPFGGAPGQPPFGGAPGQAPYGAPGQAPYGSAPGTPGFGDQNNAGGMGGGLPPYGGTPSGGGSSDKKKLIWIIVAAVAALALAAAAVWAFTAGPFAAKSSDKDTAATSGSDKGSDKDADKDADQDADKDKDKDSTKKPKADSAPGAVQAFLDALADGDVKTANTYLETKVEGAFGNQKVVEASLKEAPITDIEVEGTSDYDITGTFMVGDEEVSMDFSVRKSGKNYKISEYSLGQFSITDELAKIQPLINGQEVQLKTSDSTAFPILYEFTSSNSRVEFEGTSAFIPYDFSTSLWHIEFVLTAEADTEIREAIRASLESCLAEKTLVSSCGMDVPATLDGGETVADGTVTRTLESADWGDIDTMDLEFDYKNPLLITTWESFYPDLTATCTDTSGQTGTCDIWSFGGSKNPTIDISNPTIDISGDKLAVTWK